MAVVKITVIGMDALGQSLALALKNSQHEVSVVIHDRSAPLLRLADEAKVGHQAEWNVRRAVEGAGLIIVNEPLSFLRESFEIIAEEVRNEAVVTDTATHKATVMAWASELLPPNVHFIGSTPLLSVQRVDAQVFQRQRYAILPRPETPEAAVRLLSNAIGLLGAEPLYLDVAEHDVLMAALVHLPALAGLALVHLTTQSNAWRDLAVMAGSDYDRATHLPHEEAATLASLLHHGRAPLLHWLDIFQEEIASLRALLVEGDEAGLTERLAGLLEAREAWQAEQQRPPTEEMLAKAIDEAREQVGVRRLFGLMGGRKRG